MRLRALFEYLVKITAEIENEVAKGFDLLQFGDLMKFAHALQIQAQTLIDMVQRAAAQLGESPHSYAEAGEILLRRGIFNEKDYKRYRAIVGFRNILVHGYASIDISIIEDILKNKRYRETVELAKKILERVRDP